MTRLIALPAILLLCFVSSCSEQSASSNDAAEATNVANIVDKEQSEGADAAQGTAVQIAEVQSENTNDENHASNASMDELVASAEADPVSQDPIAEAQVAQDSIVKDQIAQQPEEAQAKQDPVADAQIGQDSLEEVQIAQDPVEGDQTVPEPVADVQVAQEQTHSTGMSEPDTEQMVASEMVASEENPPSDSNDLLDRILHNVNERLPNLGAISVADTPFPGVYEVVFGGQIIYINEDVSAVIEGSMIDLHSGVDLTDERLGALHSKIINNVDEKDMLVYPSKLATSRSITVFTDISCGFCRRLHSELDTLLEAGVSVRYMMFPRAGLDTQAHQDLESVWCADDPLEAMTIAKAGGPIHEKSCENPIEMHVSMAEQIGLRGTPLIYLDNGLRVPGYRPAPALVEMLNSAAPLEN